MRSIEEKIDIPDSRKDDFRREIMNYIGALAIEGKIFNYRTNERLQKALELKLFEDQKDSIKLKTLVSSVVDKETQEKIDVVKSRLIKNFGYDEESADRRAQLRGQHLRARRREGVDRGPAHRPGPQPLQADRPREDQSRTCASTCSRASCSARRARTSSPSPCPSSTCRTSSTAHEQGGVGQGDGESGDARARGGRAGRRRGQGRRGRRRARARGRRLARRAGRRSWAKSCSCRTSSTRAARRSSPPRIKYTGINTIGPESLRHFKRTYKQALKRQIAHGHVRPGQADHHPHPRGHALPHVQAREPARDQRGHHLHDGRVGLDGRRAEGDRPHRELLARYLAAPPVQGPRDALHHPRRGGARGRPRDVLPHPRVGRHDDLQRLQAVPRHHQGRLPGVELEHLPVPLLRRRQLERPTTPGSASRCSRPRSCRR